MRAWKTLGGTLLGLTALCTLNCGNGFDDIDDPDGDSRCVGRALTVDRQPVAGVWAYLVQDGVAMARTQTDASGSFALDVALIGPADVVLNDSAGRGALKAIALYDGENDAGDLYLQPLESIAPVVDMQGIGFEERITTERGDYLYPVYNSDRSAVFAARKKGGESSYEVVRIDLPGGEETVLREEEELYINGSASEPTLLTDRVLYYQAYRLAYPEEYPDGVRATHYVFLDTQTGEELMAVIWWDFRAGPFVSGEQLCFLEGDTRQVAYDSLFGYVYEYQMRPACLDPSSGEIRRGDRIPGWCTYAEVVASNAERTAILRVRDCDNEDPECEWDPPKPMYAVEWTDLSNRYVGSFGYNDRWAQESDWNGQYLYYLGYGDHGAGPGDLMRVDITSGLPLPVGVQGFDCENGYGEACPVYGTPRVSPDGAKLMLPLGRRSQDGTVNENLGLHLVDLETGALDRLDTRYSVNGEDYELCMTEDYPRCNEAWQADGDISLGEVFTAEDESKTAVAATIKPDGSSRARALPMGEADYSVPTILESPDGSREIVRLRDLESGFFHIHAGATGADLVSMDQVTFITANHHSPAFAPDGEHLFYFTRDPISGYEQLFQVSVAELDGDDGSP